MNYGDKIINVAEREIGYIEAPSNRTKYGKWFGVDGVPWCAAFVSWCYSQAGFQLPNIGFPKGFLGCMTGVEYFKKNNQITTSPQPGDIVFFDWNQDRRFDHVGIFAGKIDNKTFETIEGNTSLKNQSNGGQVMKRVREYGKSVFVHPKVLDI